MGGITKTGAAVDPESDVAVILPEGFGASFSEHAIRAKFIRKVYSILLSQLTLTAAIIATFWFTPAIKNFYCTETRMDEMGLLHCTKGSQNGFIMYIVSYIIFFISYFTLACCESVRRKTPWNMIAMGIFTTAMSVWAASIAIYHDIWWVLMAIGITAALCLGLTLFSFQTKWDFTGWAMYLFGICWILFIFGWIAIFFLVKSYPIVSLIYSALLAMLFSCFLIYDTQLLMGGKKYSISPEEHIYAAVQLYVDVVYIFLAILQMGRR